MNLLTLTLKDYNCPKCGNKEFIIEKRYNEQYDCYDEVMVYCECKKIKKQLKAIEKSGIATSLRDMNFDTYIAKEDWQKNALAKCKEYNKGWLYIGGQVAGGKSHLGTSVLGKYLLEGKKVKYMLWRDDSVRLKASVNSEDYYQLIDEFKRVEVLYIDDFLKTERGKQPTQADINLAYELLNYRYINKMLTIISCELFIKDILKIDEAIGSRIYELSKDNLIEIGYDIKKNFRLYGKKE